MIKDKVLKKKRDHVTFYNFLGLRRWRKNQKAGDMSSEMLVGGGQEERWRERLSRRWWERRGRRRGGGQELEVNRAGIMRCWSRWRRRRKPVTARLFASDP